MSKLKEFLNGLRIMSGYIGSDPFGGQYCRELEEKWTHKFNVRHAIAVNSATSGLLAACMAADVGPHDEVIVSPYTMSATAAAPAVLGAKVVFADIEIESFGLDPIEVAKAINKRTKAVIVTNLFGSPARLMELKRLCDEQGLLLIEDNSQAILAKENGVYTGTIGHMGVFSLNVHKHIQTGEGGIVVTQNGTLSDRLRGAMNHGEMRGFRAGLNLRMTEITAAIALDQLAKVDLAVDEARGYARKLNWIPNGLKSFPARTSCVHSYYAWAVETPTRDYKLFNLGFRPYVAPLYTLPAFPPSLQGCPVAEWAARNILVLELCHNPGIENTIKALEGQCEKV